MRTTIKSAFILAVLSVSLFSCNKSNDPTDDSMEVLSGTIESYVSGSMDSVKVTMGSVKRIVAISSAGQFSISLVVPTDLKKIKSAFLSAGVTISDTTALYSESFFISSYKSGWVQGSIIHSNGIDGTVGMISTAFIYSDKAVTITGNLVESSTEIKTYNMSLKKGWNEVAEEITSSTQTTYTTVIPSNFKWHLFQEG